MPTRHYLTRKEAAAYLTDKWFSISKRTLDRYASDGIGPEYRSNGGSALYDRETLDAWAKAFPVVSNDEDPAKPPTPAPARAVERRAARGILGQMALATGRR